MPGEKRKWVESTHESTMAEAGEDSIRREVTKPQKRLRGRRGCLQELPNMPLDIIFEIFVYMNPMDLLNLARTNRDLRCLLMSKSSACYWRAARNNVDELPDCPAFLSEPAYANLVFWPYCHNCLKPNIIHIHWTLRTRFCRFCKSILAIAQFQIFESEVLRPAAPYTILLPAERKRRSAPIMLKADVEDLAANIREVEDQDVLSSILQVQSNFVSEVNEFSRSCQQWLRKRRTLRLEEISQIKSERFEMIMQKLEESGWDQELRSMVSVLVKARSLAAKGSKPLSSREWVKIREALEQLVMPVRQKHVLTVLYSERFQTLQRFVQIRSHFPGLFFPRTRDFASLREVRTVMKAHESVKVDLLHLSATLGPNLDDMLSRWNREAIRQLFQHIRRSNFSYQDIEVDDMALLATMTFFSCQRCGAIRDLPGALVHYCQKLSPPVVPELYDAVANQMLGYGYWLPFSFECAKFVKVVEQMVSVCELDPHKATREELDELDIRFACYNMACAGSDAVLVMNWRTAALHYSQRPHLLGVLDVPLPAFPEDACRAREIEDTVRQKNPGNLYYASEYSSRSEWVCALCSEKPPSTKFDIKEHLKSIHDKLEPSENDYFRPLDAEPLPPDPVVFFSGNDRDWGLSPFYFGIVRDANEAGMAECRTFQRFAAPPPGHSTMDGLSW